MLKGQAGDALLDSYSAERAPVAKTIVTRSNQSIGEFGPVFEALGMTGGDDYDAIQANMGARCDAGEAAERQRAAIWGAIAFRKYEFDAHGVEMNHRYRSDAIVTDGQMEPAFELDAELHSKPTTWPGARLPHAWVSDHNSGPPVSTLDLCGRGAFIILTGIGGEAWCSAAQTVADEMGVELRCHVTGPHQTYVDHVGEWRARPRLGIPAACWFARTTTSRGGQKTWPQIQRPRRRAC